MKKKSWTRVESFANVPDPRTWPDVDADSLDDAEREKFQNRVKAIKLYYEGVPTKTITKVTGIARTLLPQMAQKCLKPAPDGNIYGFRSLIPYIHLEEYTRTKLLVPKTPQAKGGQSGALGMIRQIYPDLEGILIKNIIKRSRQDEVPIFDLRPTDLHKIFLKTLKKYGADQSQWPFNMKYQGIRSIERYMAEVRNRNFSKTVGASGDSVARAHLSTGTGHDVFMEFPEFYDAVEIDAYKISAILTVIFETPEGTEIDVPLNRLWLIAAVERASTAILAYSIVYRSEISARDVVNVIRLAVTRANMKRELAIPGLKYPENGGFPNHIYEQLQYACWSVTLLDNALAHLAHDISNESRKLLGFVISYGPVGHFEARPNVERTFKAIHDSIFARLPSTTGSNPHNGRAENAELQAIKYRIRAREIEEVVDVFIHQHNGTPCEGISFLSPLEFAKYYLEEQKSHFLIRKLPTSMSNQNNLLALKLVCTVRGDLKKGRRPYVQIDRAHYTSPLLANSGHLIKQKIVVEIIDEDDFRYVNAYLNNGASIGVLSARGRWSKTKHSRKTRKIINGLISKRLLVISQFDDPILAYRDYLSTPRKTKSKKQSVITAQNATEAARIGRESGIDLHIQDHDSSKQHLEKNQSVREYVSGNPYAQSLSTPSIAVIKIKKKK